MQPQEMARKTVPQDQGSGKVAHQAAALPPRERWPGLPHQALRTTELHNARLCSMIHYSELLNNLARRINGICHWNTFHMEPGSLRNSSLQRQQCISSSTKLVLWAGASLQHDNQDAVAFLGSFAIPGWSDRVGSRNTGMERDGGIKSNSLLTPLPKTPDHHVNQQQQQSSSLVIPKHVTAAHKAEQ